MPRRRINTAVRQLALVTVIAAPAATAHKNETVIRGPADDYVYQLADPGTYILPPIKPAADGMLLDEAGNRRRLHELLTNRITVMAFIYTRCNDLCPVATSRLAELRDLAAADRNVAKHLQLLSISFDPDYDTPLVMAEYARHWRNDEAGMLRWLFLTASDGEALAPLLAAYDQPVAAKPPGVASNGPLSHLLRVFLIDGKTLIRNIYSSDFLDPRLVMNDVLTLLEDVAGPDR